MTAVTSVPSAGAVTSTEFRALLGHYPTGVVAVTALHDSRPAGLVIGSFFAVSLRPPLIGFGVGHTSTSWPRVGDSAAFCVNILAADQGHVSAALARPGPDKFRSIPWYTSPEGLVVIRGSLAYLDCHRYAHHPAGDHDLIIGLVRGCHHLRNAAPLVFYRRSYWSVSEEPVAG